MYGRHVPHCGKENTGFYSPMKLVKSSASPQSHALNCKSKSWRPTKIPIDRHGDHSSSSDKLLFFYNTNHHPHFAIPNDRLSQSPHTPAMAPIPDSQPQSHAQSDDYALLHLERISQYISLPPACLSHPLPSTCASVLSPLLLSYYPPARGIVLAYEDVALSSEPPPSTQERKAKRRKQRHGPGEEPESANAKEEAPLLLHVHNEYSAPFVWATATFLVWRPAVGAWITGNVVAQASTHVSLAHFNAFPISVLRQHLPDGWRWQPGQSADKGKGVPLDEGCWVTGTGEKVERVMRVRIRDWEGRMDGKGRGKGGLKINASAVSEEVEKARAAEGTEGQRRRREGRVKGALKTRPVQEAESEAIEVD